MVYQMGNMGKDDGKESQNIRKQSTWDQVRFCAHSSRNERAGRDIAKFNCSRGSERCWNVGVSVADHGCMCGRE